MGFGNNLVEFDYEQMKMTINAKTKGLVFHLEKVNKNTFLTCEYDGNIELINKKDFSCLSKLKLENFYEIH